MIKKCVRCFGTGTMRGLGYRLDDCDLCEGEGMIEDARSGIDESFELAPKKKKSGRPRRDEE